ncbi:MAG TPA: DNA-formamidopyrimidine glycosylase family protein [Armatimonadota bacterium]|jgi:formamidopyrimidine-DNA glycosylase
MPELPEIEGMARRLSRSVLGREVMEAEDLSGTATRSYAAIPFREGVVGARIDRVGRRAKNLLLSLSTGDTLVMHFMRNGMLDLVPGEAPRRPHTQAAMKLDDGRELRMVDTMRAGRWTLCAGSDISQVSTLKGLGPEYTDPAFTLEYLAGALKGKSPVKTVIINQKVVSGIGNGYSHEILWVAGVLPDRPANTLTAEEIVRLHAAIATVFEEAIAAREASELETMGDEGWEVASIHRRQNQPCPRCGAPIQSHKMGGSVIYYCVECQR